MALSYSLLRRAKGTAPPKQPPSAPAVPARVAVPESDNDELEMPSMEVPTHTDHHDPCDAHPHSAMIHSRDVVRRD